MTRYERWANYRTEIKNKTNIYEASQQAEKLLLSYKKRINKINPKLIEEVNDDESISFFSVNKFSPLEKLVSIVNSNNYDFLNQLNDKILDIKMNIHPKNNKLTTKDGNFNEKYIFDNSPDYKEICSINDEFKKLASNITANKIKNVQVIKKDEIIPDKSKNIVLKHDDTKNTKKLSFSKIYIISSILVLLTFSIVAIFVCLYETHHFN